jgi:hypothetical protein
VRRYSSANRLNRLGTLTYAGAGCHDPLVLRLDVARFFRTLRSGLGGEAFPYLWVPEWHPGGHGLHVHFAVGRYIPRGEIDAAWERGFVHIKLLSNLRATSGPLDEARLGARYLGKYVSKNQGEQRVAGLHRYEVAQGFQPASVRIQGESERAVLTLASDRMGATPAYITRSPDWEGWHGPPAFWAQWD